MAAEQAQLEIDDRTIIDIDDTGGSGSGSSYVKPTGSGGGSGTAFSYADNALTDEERNKGLTGKTLLAGSTASGGGTVGFVLNFRKSNAGDPMPYVGEVNGEVVYFNAKGRSRDGSIQLALAGGSVSNTGTQGESQTRSDDSETFVMNSLNYKEQVALRVLAAMIKHESNPCGYDDPKIQMLVSMSFRVAIEFQNRAIEFRQAESITPGGGGVDVDTDSLADNTEKLLYNLVDILKEGIAVQGKSGNGVTPLQININKTPIEKVSSTISIKAAIFETKYIRFRFTSNMAYSDVSVYVECAVKEGETTDTRKVGFVLRKGTVAVVEELDDKVTEITSITSVSIRGKDVSDNNNYDIATETI